MHIALCGYFGMWDFCPHYRISYYGADMTLGMRGIRKGANEMREYDTVFIEMLVAACLLRSLVLAAYKKHIKKNSLDAIWHLGWAILFCVVWMTRVW